MVRRGEVAARSPATLVAAWLIALTALLMPLGCATAATEASPTGSPLAVAVTDPGAYPSGGADGAPSGGTSGRDPPQPESAPDTMDWAPNAVVERVVDGDTLIARFGGRSETVRLIGIDTPETVARTRPVQCFGAEASAWLAALVPEGSAITVVRDIEARDAYGRLLGYIVRSHDGLFVNLELVTGGYATAFNIAPNDHYEIAFSRAEAEAKRAGRGLWSACGGPDVPLY